MFIIVKNPPTSAVQFNQVLQNVVEDVYIDPVQAQTDAMNLANSNPGIVYAVFQVVEVGSAVAPVITNPPAQWVTPTSVDIPIAIAQPNQTTV